MNIYIYIYIFIHSRIYKAPIQEIYSEAPPAQPLQISLKQPAKRTFIIFRQDTDFQGSPFQVEGPTMENARRCLVAVLARGTNSWPVAEEQRARHPGRPNTYRAHKGNLGHYQESTAIPKQLSYKKCAEQM